MRKVITFSIAAYNVESYIQKCLDSFIVDSVLDKIEVIIVNDGSTDKTQVIAQTYCDKYPNSFFLINKENGGHGSTINKAIETSAGKYFKAVDGDDWVDSKQLSSVINTLETISEDIVVCNFRECYMQSEREHTVEFPFIPQKKKVLFSDIAWKETIPFHGIIYKTEILQKHRIRVTERIFFEDTELSLYPLPFVQTVFYIPTPLYCYRLEREGQSCSIQGIKKHIDDLQTVLIHSFEFYNKNYRDSGKREYYKKRIAAAFNFFYEATLNPAWYTDTVFVRKKQEIMQYLSKLNFGLYFSFIKKTKLSLLQHIFAYKHDRFLIGLQNTSKKKSPQILIITMGKSETEGKLMKKQQALVMSPFAPYKTVKHAGGKTHYYYLHKLENAVDLTLITAAENVEKDDIAVGGIKAQTFIYYMDLKLNIRDKIIHKITEKNPFDKCSGFVRHDILSFLYAAAKNLKRSGYSPDYILLDWTQAIFLAKKIKRLFPQSKLICVEQDVTYLKYERIYKQSKTLKTKVKNRIKYLSLKRAELTSLKYASEIVTFSCKDSELLTRENPALNIRVIAPYFEKYNHAVYKNTSADIVFYGAMSRPENYNAAVWFIENVFSHLPPQFRFIIAGANPDKVLAAYKSDRILITGYVENPVSIFERSLCLVVPLLLGAGIKIKILEGMSSGIPVITNSIGIEGIPAKADVDYIHCELAEEYIKAIGKLYDDRAEAAKIGKNGKQFLENTFNYERDMYISL